MADTTNAADNRLPITHVDPKQLFDTYASTQSFAGGFYPGGIEMQETPGSILGNAPANNEMCSVRNPNPGKPLAPGRF